MLRIACISSLVASIWLAPTFAVAQQSLKEKILQDPHSVINDFVTAVTRLPDNSPPDHLIEIHGCLYTNGPSNNDELFIELLKSIAWGYTSLWRDLNRVGYPNQYGANNFSTS